MKYPDILKYTDITPVFKKGDTTDKTNHGPISTLSNFSKVSEKMIYAQISLFMQGPRSRRTKGAIAPPNNFFVSSPF